MSLSVEKGLGTTMLYVFSQKKKKNELYLLTSPINVLYLNFLYTTRLQYNFILYTKSGVI